MNNMDFEAKILKASGDLTAKEKFMATDSGMCVNMLNEAKEAGEFTITVNKWAEVGIHNEKSENQDYVNFVVFTDEKGYVTSSKGFKDRFLRIWDACKEDNPDEPVKVAVTTHPSKNYNGNPYLTCYMV